ncbi:hypothetical protein AJ80_02642 [Polytolypa hystricis UAMH7299]|uniref:Uncharacterized protein n=1 Tax=Polytolypa hystricis (strain UAMH7299) TaxID=1447883 RepID=A0A2B7YNK4_POLH7|nr:hypothetical protein AJ80_02642 [Polytolypa hystricis UAMH7299]
MNPAEECATIYIDNLIPDRCWMHWSDSEDETDSEDEEGDESGDDEAQQQQQEGDEDEDEDGDDYDDESSEDGIVRTHLPTPEDDPFI